MNKKYELLENDKIQYNEKILYRIKALCTFTDINEFKIREGDLGGYIESERNLSHEGLCWVYESARIYDNAKVYENAKVYGNAKIQNYADITGSAIIKQGIIIGQVSMAYKDIFQHQCQNGLLTAILTEDNKILYSINYHKNITKKNFIRAICNINGGLEKNPHRAEYLKLITAIEIYFNS